MVLEFDFEFVHIEHPKNVVAYTCSRLIVVVEPTITIHIEVIPWIREVHGGLGDGVPDDMTAVAHFGVSRTLARLHQNGHEWDDMRSHVREFIRSCPCCQMMRAVRSQILTYKYANANALAP
jgi:Integrase zinc binding domain